MTSIGVDWLRDRNAQADDSDDDIDDPLLSTPVNGLVLLGDEASLPATTPLLLVASSRSARVVIDSLFGALSNPVLSIRAEGSSDSSFVTRVFAPRPHISVASVSESEISDANLARWARLLLEAGVAPDAVLVLDSLPSTALLTREPHDINDAHVRRVESGAWSTASPTPLLTPPHILRGTIAAVASRCKMQDIPVRGLVVYEEVVAGWPQVSVATVRALANAILGLNLPQLKGLVMPDDNAIKAAIKNAFPRQRMTTSLYM